jgi:protein NrfD
MTDESPRPRHLPEHGAGPTYYDQPSLKPAHWDWTVSTYIYLAGLGGAAQALAALARQIDRRQFAGMIKNARHLGTATAAVGAALLVLDLKTPKRWFNMLRIVRFTSPMSFGSYLLSAFGGLSALTSLSELVGRQGLAGRLLDRIAGLAQIGAGITGAGAGTYTASLLSATSTPFWAATPRHLGVLFGTSAVACAAAALAIGERLAGRHATGRRLDDIAALATLAHFATSLHWPRRRARRGLPEDVTRSSPGRTLETGDLLLAGAVPLAAYGLNRLATNNRGATLSVFGSAAILIGGLMLRHGALKLGNETARQPRTAFAFAQPEQLPGSRSTAGGRRRLGPGGPS